MNGGSSKVQQQGKHYKNSFEVIIVGSGLAGLSAAAHLVENGVKEICVLEAKNSLGGRIRTIGVNGSPLELGAQYIHGACSANSVFNLANKYKLFGDGGEIQRLHEDAGSAIKRWPLTPGYILRPDGVPISESASEQAYEIFNGIAEEAENLARLRHDHPRQASRLSTFYNGRKKKAMESLRRVVPQNDNVAEVDLALNGLQRALSIEAGHDLNKIKMEAFGTSTVLPGGTVSITKGASKLIEKLAQSLPETCLKLNHEVQKIDWSLITRDSCMPDKISVECCIQGSIVKTLQADFVICTAPLGYLQKHHERIFHPPLHPQKVHAIEDLGIGQVCKLFLEWPEPWWAANEGGIQLAWPSEPHHVHFNGLRNSTIIRKPADDVPRTWYRALCNFSEVDTQPNVLATWLAGEPAKVVDKLDDEEVLSTITDVLRSFTGDPGLSPPRRLWRHRWNSDPYVLGGWAYQSTSSADEDVEAIAQPLPSPSDPRLLFAGEATDRRYLGTLLGARLSGLREAQRILERMEAKNRIAKEVRLTSTNGF